MDLTALLAMTRRLYGEDSTSYQDDTDLTAFLNEGYRKLAERADALESKTTFSTVAGQAEYASGDTGFPTDMLRPLKVYYDDIALTPIDYREIIALNDPNGTPDRYYVRRFPQKLGLYPTPDAAKTVTLHYSAQTTALSATTDTPTLPAAYHMALCFYAASMWAASDRDGGAVQLFTGMFNDAVANFLDQGVRRTSESAARVRESGGW